MEDEEEARRLAISSSPLATIASPLSSSFIDAGFIIRPVDSERAVLDGVKDYVVTFIGLENKPGISTIGERPG